MPNPTRETPSVGPSVVDPSADQAAEIEQMREALASRTVTAQATGILASRFHLHTDHAWVLLRETSNMSNRRLADIARIVVDVHNGDPITDEADRQVTVALISVLDLALTRVLTKLDHNEAAQ